MLTYSHRGYHAQLPENTLEAFDAAITMGVAGIETDVRLSRDNQLILFHLRLTPQGYAVKDLTHQELEKCMGYKVPTLEQALSTWSHVRWDIELKSHDAVDKVLTALRQFPDRERFLLTSFDHQLIKRCARELEVQMGIITYYRPLNVAQFFADLDACPTHLNSIIWGYELFDEHLVHESQARGLRNLIFDVHTPAEHKTCQQYPLNAVITDHPQFMLN